MALKTETAHAWMKASAIMLLIAGCSLAFQGITMPLISALFPITSLDGSQPSVVIAIVTGLVIGIVFIVLAILYVLLGLGIWNYRRSVRTVMIVLGWLGVAFLLLCILGGVLLIVLANSNVLTGELDPTAPVDPTTPAQLAGVGILFVVMGIAFIPFTAVHLWLFQFEPTVRELFARGEGGWRPTINASNAAAVIRGFSINVWVSGIFCILLGIVLAIIGTVASDMSLDVEGVAPVSGVWGSSLIGIGVLLFIGGIASIIIGVGLWRLRPWSRVWALVLMWAGLAANVVYLITSNGLMLSPDSAASGWVGVVFSLAIVIFITKIADNANIRAALSGLAVPTTTASLRPKAPAQPLTRARAKK